MALASRVPEVERAAGRAGGAPCRWCPLEELPGRPAGAPRDERTAGTPGPGSECSLLYTSGTTGRPKGCILGNAYYLNAGDWYCRLGG